ncbi:MAG: hypothetical protein PVF55_06835 [Desulfobacterales bacterium]
MSETSAELQGWVSSVDIIAGQKWRTEIDRALNATKRSDALIEILKLVKAQRSSSPRSLSENAHIKEIVGKKYFAAIAIFWLRANDNADNIIKKGFGGKATNLADVEAFAPRELLAWHICDTIMQIPAKYRYSKIEIIDARHISPDTIEYVVRLSWAGSCA